MIKLVATDMDGTFLNSQNDYDRQRFDHVYDQLSRLGIRFMVASGNQYQQIRSFFPHQNDEMVYASDNGAFIFDHGQLVLSSSFQPAVIRKIVDYLLALDDVDFLLNGVKAGYMLKSCGPVFKKMMYKYNYAVREMDNFDELPADQYGEISLFIGDDARIARLCQQFNSHFGKDAEAVASGQGAMDIIIPGVNKGFALKHLLEKWGLQADELMVFGDSDNDQQMMQCTPNSFGMAKCSPLIARLAHHRAPSNDQSGVLQVLEQLVDNGGQLK
ncbi:Cof-type HAD-IIB family hydrolase [Limosilactobacillus sp.]|uniref:Cof-type HAD-IIB family hydrolase n=1 Tax=Limosilactobacillus sp. TaxID=2773925 RepID=UPI00345E5F8B